MRNNHLQKITQKTKERARRTSLKTMGEQRCSGTVFISCSTCAAIVLLLLQTRIYLRLLATRGVAKLLKHQSLDTSIFRCQPILVFTPKVCILSREVANTNLLLLWLDLNGNRTHDLSNVMLAS